MVSQRLVHLYGCRGLTDGFVPALYWVAVVGDDGQIGLHSNLTYGHKKKALDKNGGNKAPPAGVCLEICVRRSSFVRDSDQSRFSSTLKGAS